MDPKRITEAALQMPTDEQTALAAKLLANLDGPADADADEQWGEEIRRRLEEVRSGAVKTIPWSEARRRIFAAAGRDPNT